ASGYTGTMRHIVVKPPSCEEHTWDDGEVVIAPTTKPGRLFHTCTVCFDSEYTEIEPLCEIGDLSGNGGVDMADVLMLRRYLVREVEINTERDRLAADVNEDGKINAKDSHLMRRYIAGLVDSLGG
ncbi:MAG: dockerin type I repeat-containing protein, partial [Clostridia bacterium]|nr:dockerin type I repeat-containing protein [Clostridia bacterium]